MLEKVLRLYTTAMLGDVRSPVPHLVGPPGCGKSTFVEQAAEMLGVNLHVINVSRISPLELEGVQMPIENNSRLHMLTATFWTQLKEGDILFLDEFLRGFPEVMNGLLDILTSRKVGGYRLPRVFIIAASNTVVAYDRALEDRLLHLPVPDPRKLKSERKKIAQVLCDHIGLLPEMADSYEMEHLLDNEVLPTYAILDSFKKKVSAAPASIKGVSVRNLIGQALLREVHSTWLSDLISSNNIKAIADSKYQYVLLINGKNVSGKYLANARKLRGNPRLTPLQAINLELNLQLVELENARSEKEDHDDDDGLA